MKTTIKTQDLKSSLVKLKPLFLGGSLPSLDMARLSASDSILTISANNLDTFGQIKIQCSGTGFDTAIHGNRLLNAVSASDAEECTLGIEPDGIHYECQGVKMRRAAFPLAELPTTPSGPEGEPIEIDAQDIAYGISVCIGKASRDASRQILQGIFFESRETFRMVATEGHILAIHETGKTGTPFESVIPTAACQLLKEMDGTIYFIANQSVFSASSETEQFIGAVIAGQFGNYRNAIPAKKELKCAIFIDARAMIAALPYAASSSSFAADRRVRCDLYGDKITLSSKSDEGESHISIPSKTEGSVTCISFDSAYAKEVLSSFTGEVILRFRDQFGPALIEDKNTTAILQFTRVQ